MPAHKHAEMMALYAQDAMETDKPYARWEFKRGSSGWRPFTVDHPSWDEDCEYCRKPRTIRIGEFDVPEPVRKAPESGIKYWMPCPQVSYFYDSAAWYNDNPIHQRRLQRGLIHLTLEAAELHGRALAALTEIKS